MSQYFAVAPGCNRPWDSFKVKAPARDADYDVSGRSGGTGRRAGLKIRFPPGSVGSIPTFGTRTHQRDREPGRGPRRGEGNA